MNVKQTVQVSQYTMKRNSNFEFLRIVCMLMIIGGHIILAHDTMYSLSNPDEIINLLLMPFFYVHVNCFILIRAISESALSLSACSVWHRRRFSIP